MLSIKNLSKVYAGGKKAVDNMTIDIESGDFIAFIGTSGSGKTTALRMINRMIESTEGEITIDGKNIKELNPVELRRSIGYVIQQIGLMPHMTVKENIVLVPKLLKWSQEKKDEKAKELIRLVDLPEEYLDRYPSELSGGQQQRIGVVRALAAEQDIILMDEPFGALDPITRDTLQDLVKKLQQQLGKTFIFVTHDMDEAIKLADKICIMNGGKIQQYDTPENILRRPANEFIKEFIGSKKIWDTPEFIKTKDIMIQDPIKVKPFRTIVQSIEMMKSNKVDSLLVVNKENQLIGLVTLKQVRRDIPLDTKVEDVMEKELLYVKDDDNLVDVLTVMNENAVGYLPVVNKNKILVGLVTKSSLISVLSQQYLEEEVETNE